eukprot:snap_masked-scaffold395_size185061-processed-gene-0.15 protein:Tk08343 transcript:snap_masked-scaffold395_size185061-processed-gene-0.15-mRNA-1 annotation:"gtp-binding protein 10 homolog"
MLAARLGSWRLRPHSLGWDGARLATTPPTPPTPGVNPARVRLKPRGTQNWVDSLRIYVKGGSGGHGLPTLGGRGGRGGHVVVETAASASNLLSVYRSFPSGRQRLTGELGGHASRARILGPDGPDVVLKVPAGVTLSDAAGRMLFTLDEPGQRVVVANGGVGGGAGNHWFGQPGQAHVIRVDLKLIGDMGLVGFPNGGKSTFLKAVSRARPKIAGYPFTTIQPNLGQIEYADGRTLTLADLPGLIEGAHRNVGLGHKFLKHVERTRLLLFVIDVNGFQLNAHEPFRTAFETMAALNKEIECYDTDILAKPAVCLLNKMDVSGSGAKFDAFVECASSYADRLADVPESLRPEKLIQLSEILPMSAKMSPQSVAQVKERLRFHLDEHHRTSLVAIRDQLPAIEHLIQGQGPSVS